MHPILRDRRRLIGYLAAWVVLGLLLGLMLAGRGLESWREALVVSVPLAALFGLICLAAWYPCRATPVAEGALLRLVAVHGGGAVVSALLWLSAGWTWSSSIDRVGSGLGATELYAANSLTFFAAGVLLYLTAVLVHYALLAIGASRQAERRALDLKLLAQQAELEAFKSQIDPHFLFNSLNSISSLCGSDPDAARRTSVRLGEFLRESLKLGGVDEISLAEELRLAHLYLDVEQVRYGDRLRIVEAVATESVHCAVPPLVLQPLLENALKHGIAHLVEPGEVRIASRVTGERLILEVVNSCDPERQRAAGTGIGLQNIRGRLRLAYGDDASVRVLDSGHRFEVQILMPRLEAAPSTAEDIAERAPASLAETSK